MFMIMFMFMFTGYIWQKFWSIQKFMKEKSLYVFIIWKKFIMKKKKYMFMKVYLYERDVSRITYINSDIVEESLYDI